MKRSLTSLQRLRGRAGGLSCVFASTTTRAFRTGGGKLLVHANGLNVSRFAVVLAKGFPSSVVRNRVKRWVRESVRQGYRGLPPGWDIVFVLYFSPHKEASWYRSLVVSLLQRSSLMATLF